MTQADAMAKVGALEAAFRAIAATRMRGVPLLNPRLAVQAVGFAPHRGEHGEAAVGVLVTPWFMNLVRLPAGAALAVGAKAERELGGRMFEFIGADEAGVGAFEAASLFSPMDAFADQAAAVATAREVLALLRPPVAMAAAACDAPAAERAGSTADATAANARADRDAAVASRRGFLLGRSAGPRG